MSRYGPFVPQKFARDISYWLHELAGLSVYEQLAQRHIHRIEFEDPWRGAKASLPREPGGFYVRIHPERHQNLWSVSLGHEIGHTFFWSFLEDNERPVPKPGYYYGPYGRQNEEFCKWFQFQWAMAGNNHSETIALLGESFPDTLIVSHKT